MLSRDDVERDFDRIAPLEADARCRLTPPERWLLAQVPADAALSVDLGAGTGALARAIAIRTGGTVLAVDLSLRMLTHARSAGGTCSVKADVAAPPLPPSVAHCVVAVAVLHHLPDPVATLRAWASLLRPGGVLLVQDLLDRPGWRAAPVNALALLAALPTMARSAFSPSLRALRAAYEAHGAGERYLTMEEAEALPAAAGLPDARVRAHLGWRYSLVWRKPATSTPG